MERIERKGWRPLTLGEAVGILRAAGPVGDAAGTTLVTLAPDTGTTLVVLDPDGVALPMTAMTTRTSGGAG